MKITGIQYGIFRTEGDRKVEKNTPVKQIRATVPTRRPATVLPSKPVVILSLWFIRIINIHLS